MSSPSPSSSSSPSPLSNLSVFIPYVFSNITKEFIAHSFETNNLGCVQQVDFVKKIDRKGKVYNRAYIHFNFWYDNTVAIHFKERVLSSEKGTRLVYDDPWFWVVLQNTGTKFVADSCQKSEVEVDVETKEAMDIIDSYDDEYDENDQDRSFVRYSKNGESETYDIISNDYVSLLELQLEESQNYVSVLLKQIRDLERPVV